MIEQSIQKEKAERFRKQHLGGKLLILPNIWDAMGARMMELTGFGSVATASVSVAISNGYADGENIPFAKLVEVVNKIADSVNLPVTVDMERGYAGSIAQLKENIQLLIENGAVGINIEDSLPDHSGFYSVEEQCRKIEAVRETASRSGVPIFINARTDFFVLKIAGVTMEQAIERAIAYKKAGADGIYPILIQDYDLISRFIEEVGLPVNVNLLKPVADMHRLEKMGVARVSVGPQLLNHLLAVMKELGEGLRQYDSTAFFSRQLLSREILNKLVYH